MEAVDTQIVDRIGWDQGVLDHEPQMAGPGAHLWTRTSLRPVDVEGSRRAGRRVGHHLGAPTGNG